MSIGADARTSCRELNALGTEPNAGSERWDFEKPPKKVYSSRSICKRADTVVADVVAVMM